ncbi:PRC-barrel domain-containing protein [Pacificimonas flava]|uniref:PRC-barrel domain-containing protein n=1 Tax=Pacificimonas flava TaxID=1234595 RepID=M2U5I8_9SPHN|nr:hypothetical protein C725_1164 [Pacificimonas flava]MBB5279175.1 sporulation protein YlmC with PRC-barrel domain [Pacificimonas flava]
MADFFGSDTDRRGGYNPYGGRDRDMSGRGSGRRGNRGRDWDDDESRGRRGGGRVSGDRLIASDRVEGTRVYDRRGNRLGTIENFMVDKRSGHVEYAILSFGGFLGMGDRHYPLPWDELTYDQDEGGYVVNVTEQDLEEAPSHRAGQNVRYDRNYSNDIRSYYGGMGW